MSVVLDPAEDPLIVYLHIQKTAGSSVHAALEALYGARHIYWHGVDGFLDDLSPEEAAHLTHKWVVGGHIDVTVAERVLRHVPRQKVFVALIRHPVAQIVSHFEFVSQRPDNPLHTGTSLLEELESNGPFARFSRNLQCRTLSGTESAAETLASFGRNAWLVGTVENLPPFQEAMGECFGNGAPLELPCENAQPCGYEAKHGGRALTLAGQLVAEDLALFDAVSRQGLIET